MQTLGSSLFLDVAPYRPKEQVSTFRVKAQKQLWDDTKDSQKYLLEFQRITVRHDPEDRTIGVKTSIPASKLLYLRFAT